MRVCPLMQLLTHPMSPTLLRFAQLPEWELAWGRAGLLGVRDANATSSVPELMSPSALGSLPHSELPVSTGHVQLRGRQQHSGVCE